MTDISFLVNFYGHFMNWIMINESSHTKIEGSAVRKTIITYFSNHRTGPFIFIHINAWQTSVLCGKLFVQTRTCPCLSVLLRFLFAFLAWKSSIIPAKVSSGGRQFQFELKRKLKRKTVGGYLVFLFVFHRLLNSVLHAMGFIFHV